MGRRMRGCEDARGMIHGGQSRSASMGWNAEQWAVRDESEKVEKRRRTGSEEPVRRVNSPHPSPSGRATTGTVEMPASS